VEHHDRLARLGVELLQAALASSGHRLVVLDPEETTSDLAGDITEVSTCMCPAVWAPRGEEPRCPRYRCGHG
jgi:putative resolvase